MTRRDAHIKLFEIRQLQAARLKLDMRRYGDTGFSIAIPRDGSLPPQFINLHTGAIGIVRPARG